jgi:eukaryotic translation initiation factor 2-alpha kinase 4
MYSLGIILFEMAHPPFATQMERARALTALRAAQQLPPDFAAAAPPLVQKIILQLVSPNPAQRPSAAALLESGELPGKLEVEEVYLQEALGTLTNPQSLAYGRLVRALFEPRHGVAPEVDATYEMDWLAQQRGVTARVLAAREAVVAHVRAVFQLHGALPLSAPLFRPRPSGGGGGEGNGEGEGAYPHPLLVHAGEGGPAALDHHHHHHRHEEPQRGVGEAGGGGGPDYLDADGALVRLPTDLLVPFARYVARAEATHVKRYALSKVYRRQEAGGHPKEELSAQLDLVYDAR